MEAFLVILLWLIIFIFVIICLNRKKNDSEYVIFIPNLNLITKNSNMIEKYTGEKKEESLRCKYSLGRIWFGKNIIKERDYMLNSYKKKEKELEDMIETIKDDEKKKAADARNEFSAFIY